MAEKFDKSSSLDEIKPPDMSPEDVPNILKSIFGLKTKSVKVFKSYDDKNYLVKVSQSFVIIQ